MKTIRNLILLMLFAQIALAQGTNYGSFAGSGSIGSNNTNFGYATGFKNNGQDNTSVGWTAGQNNTGNNNSFFGSSAGYKNSGYGNSFFGFNAGFLNKGTAVTALGELAGSQNTGAYSVFVGNDAGYKNMGYYNVAVGFNSGHSGINGENNTFLGAFSGAKNTSGLHNTYIGAESGQNNLGGAYNTYLGMRAGASSIGSNNVFIGYQTGRITTASHKLIIANEISNTTPLITGDFKAKHVAIGGTGDTKYTLHVMGTAYTTGSWTSSDVRFKKNIKKIDNPLQKLMAVNGVSYEFKADSARNFYQGKTYGFIAQEVQKVMPALVQEDEQGYLALNYECFIPLLVEALKQQETIYQQRSTTQQEQIEKLEKELLQLKRMIFQKQGLAQVILKDKLTNGAEEKQALSGTKGLNMSVVVLHQNTPNPFNQATTIAYEVAKEAQQIALYVYDMSGKPLLEFLNLPAGRSSLTINGGQLKPGIYLYSLLVDGQIADTRRMILTQ